MEKFDATAVHTEVVEQLKEQALGTVRLYDENNTLRLIPVPTDDPNDPLNLPMWRKHMILATMILWQLGGMSMPDLPPGIDLTKPPPGGYKSIATISLLGSLPSLFMGMSNFITVPLCLAIGRRAILCILMTLTTACMIWAALSKNFDHHLAARCVMGIGAGSFESLSPLVLHDVYFVHQRGNAIGAMWTFSAAISYLFGVMSSKIVNMVGWRWLYGIFGILSALGTVMMIFFVPETRYVRAIQQIDGELIDTDAYGNIRVIGKVTDTNSTTNMVARSPSLGSDSGYKPRSWANDMKFSHGNVNWANCWTCYRHMLKAAFLPNIAWVVILNSICIAISISSLMTYAQPLMVWEKGGPWTVDNLGLSTLAMLPACFLSFFLSGWGMDWISKHMAKKNGGIHEPESRLPSLILPSIFTVIGSVIYGVSSAHTDQYHWAISLLGAFFLNFGFLSLNTSLSVYAVECYPRWAGPLLVMVCALRNVVGFAMNFKIVDFINACGYDGAFGIYAGIFGGFALIGIPIYVWGKRLREWSAGWAGLA
ncbi:major facilitator superfamily domain-containing protein [Tricharina praecox]|uniref:major facilitator superfamily domain-containing protein n=1 Tax=Tricharina praecox TaxID=43433 RepID=UPI00221E56D8|nr:major facilitator superfamily domain-containing protein [Tricharina praecox]KAI5842378.1 major facilitator superfamily domain-containing protein [Tricharina praecox]